MWIDYFYSLIGFGHLRLHIVICKFIVYIPMRLCHYFRSCECELQIILNYVTIIIYDGYR